MAKNVCHTDSARAKSWHMVPWSMCKNGLTAINVPGKKRVVNMAIIFIAELSRLLATVNSFESRAISRLMRLNSFCL